jgi:2-phosphosulfolactate phosphatase
MPQTVTVHFLPVALEPASLQGSVAIVLDVLRATTTIVQALASGAANVIATETIDEARERFAALPVGTALLGGERGGVRIEGFFLGNSPLEYTSEVVAGKTICLTTTNGTRALARSRYARHVLVGSFSNLRAVVAAAANSGLPIHIVCAGTDGHVTAEDVLCAGAIATALENVHPEAIVLDDSARVASAFWKTVLPGPALREAMRASRGGANLVELGYDRDIDRCAEIDRCDLVPEFASTDGVIVPTGLASH